MILVCGATGDLGGRVARRLVDDGRRVRALVRPTSDATELEGLGVEVVRGDLRDAHSLVSALAGVDTVVTTANALSRIMGGDKDLTLSAVDMDGNRNLVRAAEDAGVRRFVFLSTAGLDQGMGIHAPLAAAKLTTEELLRHGPMDVVMVRPDMFQEVWLAPLGGIDAANGTAMVYGRGDTPHRYVAIDDVAALVAHLAVADRVPSIVEFGGPEALTVNEAVAASGEAVGTALKTRHLPRPVLSIASRLMARPKPALASLMAMAQHSDTTPAHGTTGPCVRRESIPGPPRHTSRNPSPHPVELRAAHRAYRQTHDRATSV